jgi:hypothetical protein
MKGKIKNKKSAKVKTRIIGAALITTLLLGGTASQASAFNPLQFIGDLKKKADSFLFSIKNDPTISKILGEINQVATIFLPQIQQFTNLSNADINKIKGALNVLAPSETQRAIDEKEKASKTPSVLPSQGTASRTASSVAAESVLSKESQELEVKNLDQISKLVEESTQAAENSAASSYTAQEVDSSQDVLKILSSQNSNQSAINAAQLRLLALQNSNLQAIKIQLAVANQANANTAGIAQGETQKKILQEQEKSISNWRENHTRYGRGS